MKFSFVSFTVMVIFLLQANVFADSQPKIDIKMATLEEVDRKIEKFIRKIDDSLQGMQAIESIPHPVIKADLKIKYSLREPQIKGVTDFKSRFNVSVASSFNR